MKYEYKPGIIRGPIRTSSFTKKTKSNEYALDNEKYVKLPNGQIMKRETWEKKHG